VLPDVDTIVALSTPPGRSGIGVIRLSGPASLQIAQRLVDDFAFSPEPGRAFLRNLYDPETHNLLDQALVTYFRGPRSFTGEDVVELSCHGSPVLLGSIIETTLRLNARIADPGEFTLRAVSHGKMDLTQAEALRDLIEAETRAAVRQATRQMHGEVSHLIRPLRDQLLDVIVRLESSLEFVEDELPPVDTEHLVRKLRQMRAELETLAESFAAGRLLRDGLRVALAGRPNVGKSSLFNGLLARDRAIVTDWPGTTRDTLTEAVFIDGIAVHLTDTAGIRDATGPIEFMGVQRARRAVADADVTVLVLDGSEDLTPEDCNLLIETENSPRLVALNKNDLLCFKPDRLNSDLNLATVADVVSISAKTGSGLDELRASILKPFNTGKANGEGLVITNARHYDLLRRSAEEILASERLLLARASEEFTLVGLHNSLRYLGEILGETTTNDILAQIFSTFCIGK